MLNPDERQRLIAAIATYLNTRSNPRAEIVALCAEPDFGIQLKYADSPMGWADQLVAMLVADAWNHTPPWLFCVLSKFEEEWPWAEPIRQRIKAPPASWQSLSDPLDALWLDSSRAPFLDRSVLRGSLRDLANPETGSSVLLVNGGRKSGKSYTVELLRHWQQRRQGDGAAGIPGVAGRPPAVALVTHYQGMGASLGPEVLARRIVDGMQRPEAELPPPTATPNRTSHYLVDWVLEQADASGKAWWVVIDSLNDPDIPEQTRNIVSILAQSVTGVIAKKAIRLILVDYPPAALHGVQTDEHAREQIGPIGEIDLKPFFKEVLGKNGALPDKYIDSLVQLVTTLVPTGDLSCLNQYLTKVATAQSAE